VVDGEGRVIISPDVVAAPPGRDASAIPVVAAALSNQVWEAPHSQLYTGLLAQRTDGVWNRVPKLGWYVIVEAPFSISGRENWIFGLNQAFLLISTALVVLVLGRRLAATITRPLERLQSEVARLRSGERPRPLALGRRDEIGQLAIAFHSMASDLYAQQIEIKARNQDLAVANHELQKALQAALAASQLKSQFVATISHELRTPLTGVLGYSEMLGLGVYGPLEQEQADTLAKIQRNGEHLLALINDLLDFSKLEAGKLELDDQVFDVREQITMTISDCEPQARSKQLVMHSALAGDLPAAVRGDPLRLRQILLNLLSNAIKFTDAGTVTVHAGVRRAQYGAVGTLTIAVEDTGIGIAPADHSAIFDAFRQVDGSYARRSEGTGLGLSITRRLVELMGGEITLDSQLGTGSRFTVTLPLLDVEALDEDACAGGGRLVAD
jgi:signal transduction histidine kinase